MACVDLSIEIPGLPPVFVPGIQIPGLPLPISGDFCCKFVLANPAAAKAILLAINTALANLGGAVNVVIGMIEAEIMAVAEPVLQLKLSLSISCPMNSVSTDDL